MYKRRDTTICKFGKSFPTGNYGYNDCGYYPGYCTLDSETILKSAFFKGPKTRQAVDYWGNLLSSSETFFSTERKPPKWNACDHNKVNNRISLPYGYLMRGDANTRAQGVDSMHSNWYNPVHGDLPDGFEVDDFFRSRAMASMAPRFESDFQALNFLFELKDFKEVPTQITKFLDPTNKFWRKVDKWNRDYGWSLDRTLYKTRPASKGSPTGMPAGYIYSEGAASAAAKSWLAYTMAYLPLMKDIVAYGAAAATEYDMALSAFKKKGLTLNTRHYSEYLMNESHTNVIVEDNAYVPTLGLRVSSFAKATASLSYRYSYTLNDQSEAFARYWGLTGTAEEFWNMLPFSFLVDYFLQISKALKLTEVDKNLDLDLTQYCESLLCYTGTSTMMRASSSLCCGIIDGEMLKDEKWHMLNSLYSSRYTRQLMAPPKVGIIVPKYKLPSTRQRQNILALAKVLIF